MSDESRLVAGLRAGEQWAVSELYTAHAASVLGWVLRLGGPNLDAEDTAQEVFIVALRTASRFRGDARLSTWLFGITRRVLANARRKAVLRRFVGLGQIAEPHSLDRTDEAVIRHQQRRAIQRALARLKPAQREVLVLIDLEERPAPEAAAMLGIPTGTAYSRLHAARRAFRSALRREGIEAPDAADNVVPLHRRRT